MLRRRRRRRMIIIMIVLIILSMFISIINIGAYSYRNKTVQTSAAQSQKESEKSQKQELTTFVKTYMHLYTSQKWNALTILSTKTYGTKISKEIAPLFLAIQKKSKLTFTIKGESYEVKALTGKDAAVVSSMRIERGINGKIIVSQKELTVYLTKSGDKWLVSNMSDDMSK